MGQISVQYLRDLQQFLQNDELVLRRENSLCPVRQRARGRNPYQRKKRLGGPKRLQGKKKGKSTINGGNIVPERKNSLESRLSRTASLKKEGATTGKGGLDLLTRKERGGTPKTSKLCQRPGFQRGLNSLRQSTHRHPKKPPSTGGKRGLAKHRGGFKSPK